MIKSSEISERGAKRDAGVGLVLGVGLGIAIDNIALLNPMTAQGSRSLKA